MRTAPLLLSAVFGLWLTGVVALAAPRGATLAARSPGKPAAPAPRPAPSDAEREAEELFEREVRPLLLAECAGCHGAQAAQGGLRLDGRAAALRGGQRGPAIVPGRPEQSLLIRAVRRQGLAMPPGKPLPEARVAALERWVRLGAPWPEAPKRSPSARHWAFRPLKRPPIPKVRNARWVRNPVDAFVLARLETAGLAPSPEADRRTLIRRVTYDLIGLPPTPEEVEAFVRDPSPDAYEKLVDRLLASPHYGERWARLWLDVARYADTKDGVLLYGDARIRPYAYTYRDYVIRALNEDTPYARFVQEQLAADLLSPPVPPWRLAALGFLTLGRQFDNNIHDVIDDRIDTVTRGLLGLTVACARCHDHKYDPIPTADYYSLYGVFASSQEPLDLPVIEPPQETPDYAAFAREDAAKRRELEALLEREFALQRETARRRTPDYLVHVATTEPDPLETAIFFLSLSPEDLRPQIVARWRRLLAARARPEDPVFGPWSELMAAARQKDPAALAAVVARWRARPHGTAPGQLNPLVAEALAAARLSDVASVARTWGELLVRVAEQHAAASPGAPAAAEPRPEVRQLLELIDGPESPAWFRKSETYYYLSRAKKDRYSALRNELDVIAVRHPDAPGRAMLLVDAAEPYEPRIFRRGNPGDPGERVPRRFLALLAGPNRRPFSGGSGRLDLARAIIDPANPLTWRVLVNRVWMHHFGEPLVRTPSDFGLRSDPPTHPELLDWLATEFLRMGGSLKRLHRLLVTSAAYRQSSAPPAARTARGALRDPENRLLWRAHRRRLDFEQMRDTLLALSGRLDPALYGRPLRDATDPENRRRTLYALVDRQSLPEVFRAFDFPQPDQSVERRAQTTGPQQALFGLNSRFVLEAARALAARVEGEPRARIEALYWRVFARRPRPEEVAAGLEFLRRSAEAGAGTEGRPGPWEQYAQVLLLANETMFLD